MKKCLSTFLTLIMIVGTIIIAPVSVSAEISGDFEYAVKNGEAEISKYNGSGGDVTIPSNINGYPVISIAGSRNSWNVLTKGAFEGCTSLKSVKIPDTVKIIDEDAFHGCTSLTNVSISNSVTSIHNDAFYGCTSLTSVSIPNSVAIIGDLAFAGCSKLKSIYIPGNSMISSSAFNGTEYAKTPGNWSDGVLYVGNHLIKAQATTITTVDTSGKYFNIPGVSGSYIVRNGTIDIASSAFKNCKNLTSVTIPESVRLINLEAFEGCESLISIKIPNQVKEIEDYMFRNCKSLTSIEMPEDIRGIGNGVFEGCSALTSFVIPDSVTKLGYKAFENCTGLRSVKIPDTNKGNRFLGIFRM